MSLLSSSPSDVNTSNSSSNSFRDSPIPTASFLFATEFIHGAGVVIFHRSSSRVVLIHDRADPSAGYFFPKGRKDIGESLPQAATREGHEESGFPNRLLPVRIPTRQPTVENGSINAAKLMLHNIGKKGGSSGRRKRIEKSTEAVYTHFMPFRRGRSWPKGGVYILSWFIAEVTDDDVQRIEAAQAEKLREDEEKKKKKREKQGGDATESWQDWINCLNEEGMSPNGVKSSSGATTTDGDGKVKALKPLDEHELQYKAELVPYDVARKRLRSNWVILQLFETALVLVKDLDNDDDDDDGEEEDESKNVKE